MTMRTLKSVAVILLMAVITPLQAQRVFNDLNSVLQYAGEKSTSLQSGQIKIDQAKKAKLAALASIPDPSGDMNLSYTNNTRLPVSMFPSELLGGEKGTYTQVRTGIQYNTNFSQTMEIKLVNLPGWQALKSAKLNVQASSINNLITRRSLYNDLASTYFNIVQLNEQLRSTEQNLLANDTLLRIAENKYNQGVIKIQDVNDVRINYLSTKENINQIRYLTQQQYLALKILADIPEDDSIIIQHPIELLPARQLPLIERNLLDVNSSLISEKLAASTYRKNKYAKLPTLSFFLSDARQQYNTRSRVFDSNADWLHSSYLGFKISVPFLSASMLSANQESRYNYLLAKKSSEQTQIQSGLQYQQLSVEYEKAWSKLLANRELLSLRKDSYYKNRDLFEQGIIDANQVLTTFNAMVNSNYELITSRVSVLLASEKISINNTIK